MIGSLTASDTMAMNAAVPLLEFSISTPLC
jgi:hypothetical protein